MSIIVNGKECEALTVEGVGTVFSALPESKKNWLKTQYEARTIIRCYKIMKSGTGVVSCPAWHDGIAYFIIDDPVELVADEPEAEAE